MSKLKQNMDKYKTIYFLCKASDDIKNDNINHELQNAGSDKDYLCRSSCTINSIDSKWKQFSTDILDKVTKIVDEN